MYNLFPGYGGIHCETVLPTQQPTRSTLPPTTGPSTTTAPCSFTNSCTGHYTCLSPSTISCIPTWTGSTCTDRDPDTFPDPECPADNTCLNGGTCFNRTCCCPPGFTGDFCETDIIECLSNPCPTWSVCEDLINGYRCVCRQGSSGDWLSQVVGYILHI